MNLKKIGELHTYEKFVAFRTTFLLRVLLDFKYNRTCSRPNEDHSESSHLNFS